MKKYITFFFNNEILSYLFFGVAATIVSVVTRLTLYHFTHQVLLSTILANITAILFAFVTNDTIVFKQERKGWKERLVKFISARISTLLLDILLAQLLVETFPSIIGQFVNQNKDKINSIETLLAQVLIIIFNYVLSKVFVFKDKKIRE